MSETTHRLKLPYIMPSQAQKHVTHNEALRMLDAVVHLVVDAFGTNDPPASPQAGEQYMVGESPTGDWFDHGNEIAVFIDGAWIFFEPRDGWMAWSKPEGQLVVYTGDAWEPVANGATQDFTKLGINADASEYERLVVQSSSVLLNHDGSDQRTKLNKAGSSNTASLVFQSGYSGRAEFGLPGEDDFQIKVSDDGNDWHQAMRVNSSNGEVSFPASGVALSADIFSNLLPDSGRFNLTAEQHSIYSTTPVSPTYLKTQNSASISFPHKFVHNNSTFGGSGAALNPVVEDLITTIYGPDGVRYGPEFWCMKIDAGDGTSYPKTINGEQYYYSTLVKNSPRPLKYTTGFFVRAMSEKLAIRPPFGDVEQLLRNGEAAIYGTSDVVVSPQDGWTYFEIQIARSDLSYDLSDMAVLFSNPGSAFFALPRVLPGWVTIGSKVAIVPNDQVFGS
ncbi:MAG: DUF2793 domain-containing protein [Pseudomonadota bacterium]